MPSSPVACDLKCATAKITSAVSTIKREARGYYICTPIYDARDVYRYTIIMSARRTPRASRFIVDTAFIKSDFFETETLSSF